MLDAVLLGDFQAVEKGFCDCVLVCRVHRVAAGDHHDNVGFQAEGFDAVDEIIHIARVDSWEERDLGAAGRDFGEVSDMSEFR